VCPELLGGVPDLTAVVAGELVLEVNGVDVVDEVGLSLWLRSAVHWALDEDHANDSKPGSNGIQMALGGSSLGGILENITNSKHGSLRETNSL